MENSNSNPIQGDVIRSGEALRLQLSRDDVFVCLEFYLEEHARSIKKIPYLDLTKITNFLWDCYEKTITPSNIIEETSADIRDTTEMFSVLGDASNVVGGAFNAVGEVSNIIGEASNIVGDVANVGGDVANVGGDVANVGGETANVFGDVSNVGGEASNAVGETSNVDGEVSNVVGLLSLDSEDENLFIVERDDTLNVAADKWMFFSMVGEFNQSAVFESICTRFGYDDGVDQIAIQNLYRSMVLEFCYETINVIFEKWHTLLPKPYLLGMLKELSEMIYYPMLPTKCTGFCKHFQTLRNLFDHIDCSYQSQTTVIMPVYRKLVQSKCPMSFRWSLNRYLNQSGSSFPSKEECQELLEMVEDTDILKYLVQIIDKNFDYSWNDEKLAHTYIDQGFYELLKCYDDCRERLGKKINYAILDYDMFYLAVSKGHLDIVQWLYTKFKIVYGKTFNLHSNLEEPALLAIRSGNLAMLEWLDHATGYTINFRIAHDYLFKEAAENGHTEIAHWICNREPSFKLELNDNDTTTYLVSPRTSYNVQFDPDDPKTLVQLLMVEYGANFKSDIHFVAKTCPCCGENQSKYWLILPCSHELCLSCAGSYYFSDELETPHRCLICRARFATNELWIDKHGIN